MIRLFRWLIGLPVAGFGGLLGLTGCLMLLQEQARTSGIVSIVVGVILLWLGKIIIGRRSQNWRDDSPSEKQLSFARDLGIVVKKGMTKGEVSDLISEVTGR